MLRANGEDHAEQILAEAWQLLHDHATTIADPLLRRAYLEEVPLYCAIMRAFAENGTILPTVLH